jgi:hypothetical protein
MDSSSTQAVLGCLDSLAVSLAEHGHRWSDQQRREYEHAADLLVRTCIGSRDPEATAQK